MWRWTLTYYSVFPYVKMNPHVHTIVLCIIWRWTLTYYSTLPYVKTNHHVLQYFALCEDEPLCTIVLCLMCRNKTWFLNDLRDLHPRRSTVTFFVNLQDSQLFSNCVLFFSFDSVLRYWCFISFPKMHIKIRTGFRVISHLSSWILARL